MQKIHILFFVTIILNSLLFADSGKKVFETYCWGCHHQTAVAFGPPFSEIASKRTAEEIQGMITDPASVSKVLGYRRNAMPAFTLNPQELRAITAYIFSFKDKKESNESKEINDTKVKESYPNMAANKESK
ncbi:MAG TPA: cytochrome c [Epsilonproteobacteria bacterium]|nr:cytochrome c [Campylobacterota bacterium]